MSRIVKLSHIYEAQPKHVWEVATDFDCLAEAMRGLIRFDGLPKGRLHAGQVIDVQVSLFGLLPAQPYRMELLAFDPEAMHFLSDEQGMGVKTWRHRLQVSPHPNGAELIDEIEIDAGWRTGLVAMWAGFMYRRRHKPRMDMLRAYSERV